MKKLITFEDLNIIVGRYGCKRIAKILKMCWISADKLNRIPKIIVELLHLLPGSCSDLNEAFDASSRSLNDKIFSVT